MNDARETALDEERPGGHSLVPHLAHAESVLKEVTETFAAGGFDLVHAASGRSFLSWMQARWETLPKAIAERSDPLTVVVGNTRALWPHFVAWLSADPARRLLEDPLDTYSAQLFARVAGRLSVPAVWWGAWEPAPRQVDMQFVAHGSGLATYSRACYSIHPRYGLWFALRGVMVMGVEPFGQGETPRPQNAFWSARVPWSARPCEGCTAPCRAVMERRGDVLALPAGEGEATESAEPAEGSWQYWLAIRDACPVGRAHRYSDEQIAFHYDRRLPEVVRESLPVQPEQDQGEQDGNPR